MKLVQGTNYDTSNLELMGLLNDATKNETDERRKAANRLAFWATCLVHDIKMGKDVLEGDVVDTMSLRRLLEEADDYRAILEGSRILENLKTS